MTNDAPPPVIPPRKKLPFEEQQRPFGNAMQQGALLIYGLLAVGLAGLAFYNGAVQRLPLAYVAAPAIGAVWFGLRLFMMLNSRK